MQHAVDVHANSVHMIQLGATSALGNAVERKSMKLQPYKLDRCSRKGRVIDPCNAHNMHATVFEQLLLLTISGRVLFPAPRC